MSVGIAILALAVLVLLHEAGHFAVARAVGMTPRKFYLGFGPPLLRRRSRSGVEYGIAALPLGGYVKIPGMHRPSAGDLRKTLEPRQQEELAPGLDVLDAALERGDEPAALAAAEQLRPALGGNRLLQELVWALAPDAYWRQRAWKKIAVIAAGPAVNVAIAVALFVAVFMSGQLVATRTVAAVLPHHPAVAAGLRAGDRIERVAGHPVGPDGIAPSIDATRGKPFTIVVDRHGKRVTIGPLRARLDQAAYRVGFEIGAAPGPGDSFPTALWRGVRLVGQVTAETASSIAGLFVGSGTRNVSSAVGIVRATSSAYQQSARDFVGVVGLVSLALGLLNLLPVLPLDGGHIVMSLAERLHGRSFSQLAYVRYSAVGITLFVFLLYLGLRNDFGGAHS